ncbi:MAG TPA: hypothetical protein VGA87_04690, partial [Pyrinomonadaceae bacterium]
MTLITDKHIRQQISRVLKNYLKNSADESVKRVTLKDLDSISNLIVEGRKEAKRDTSKAYQKELSISYLSIMTLTMASLAVNQ